MGYPSKQTVSQVRLRKGQRENLIKPTSQSGEWYKDVDPITGAIKYLRKSEKKNLRKRRP